MSRALVAEHEDLAPGELVVDACYGLGQGVQQPSAGGSPASGWCEADVLDGPGILALTGSRLLFLPTRSPRTAPKAARGAWMLDEVVDLGHDPPRLAVRFADGAVATMDIPPIEGAEVLARAFRSAASR